MATRFAKITIVFDNYSYLQGFPKLWGFSCFVQTDENIFLFDTGSNGRVLLKNMDRLGVDLKKSDSLILSHPHWDHIGGLDSVVQVNPNLDIFVPSSLSKHLIHDLKSESKSVTVINEQARQIMPSVYTTGTMGEIGEQSIVIDTQKGLVVITGCAHPGIVNIAYRAIQMLQKPIYLLMGGFHLMYKNEAEISNIISSLKEMEIENFCPTHCSGDLAIKMFKDTFGDRYIHGGTGKEITV